MRESLLTLLCMVGLSASGIAQTFTDVDGVKYEVLDPEARTCAVVGTGTVVPEVWVIPDRVTFDNDITYTVTEIKKANKSSLLAQPHEVKLPPTITTIGSEAFYNTHLTKINLPEGLTTIGNHAFYYCTGLSEITLPESLTTIENQAFSRCSSLSEITIPGNVKTIGYEAFHLCTNLKEVIISEGVTSTGLSTFEHCSIEKLTLPASLETINTYAFENNPNIKEIYFNTDHPSRCKIENYAFDCYDSATLYLHGGFNELSSCAWGYFTHVDALHPSDHHFIYKGIQYTVLDEDAKTCQTKMGTDIAANDVQSDIELPSVVKDGNVEYTLVKIGAYSFYGAEDLNSVILPESIEEIDSYAFAGCKNLYDFTFGENITKIGNGAFSGCELLSYNELPSSLLEIGEDAFHGCTTLSNIILPENIRSIGAGAFAGCTKLEKAVLFSDLTEIPENCFADCTALGTVYLPSNLVKIGDMAFRSTSALEQITLPATVESIGQKAFDKSALAEINFPSSLKEIGISSFANTKITNADLSRTALTVIPETAFDSTHDLMSVKLPDSLESIEKNAFRGYNYGTGMLDITLPASLTELAGAFTGRKLTQIVVPNKVKTLEDGSCGESGIVTLGASVKSITPGSLPSPGTSYASTPLRVLRCMSKTAPNVSADFGYLPQDLELITVIVPEGCYAAYQKNPRWQVFNMVEESETEAVVYLTGEYPLSEEIRMQSGAMPGTVNKLTVAGVLSDSDFRLIRENMVSLNYLDISGVSNTVLPKDAFKNMTGLVSISLPDHITEIGANAFYGDNLLRLSGDRLPFSITRIGEQAFSGCSRLVIDYIPASVESIGRKAFYQNSSIRELTIDAIIESIESGTFCECTGLEFVDMTDSYVKTIGYDGFRHTGNLETILLPECLETISEAAFAYSGLRYIDFPESVTTIGNSAFTYTGLRTITLPNIETVNTQILAECNRLKTVNMPSSVKKVQTNALYNNINMTALSCSAIDAPDAATGALSGVSAKKCSLTIPQQSFRSYLNAPQWGMFSTLRNRIVAEIPKEVETSAVSEEEYQTELTEQNYQEMAQESSQEALEAPARIRARHAARAAMTDGSAYGRVFDGAQLSTPVSSGMRFFFRPADTVQEYQVYYNNEDITSQVENNSVVIPVGTTGTLKVIAKSVDTTAVESVESADSDMPVLIYDLNGIMVGNSSDSLRPGIYIRHQGTSRTKIVVR